MAMMDWRRIRVGTCTCALGLGLYSEIAGVAHRPGCSLYGKDAVVCARFVEAVMPPHVHSTEVGTPGSSDQVIMVSPPGLAITPSAGALALAGVAPTLVQGTLLTPA